MCVWGEFMIPNGRAFNGKETFEAEGKTFCRSWKILKHGKFCLAMQVKQIHSTYKQGIAFSLSTSPVFKGSIHINGINWPIDTRMNHVIPVSLDAPYDKVIMDLNVRDGYIRIANASDFLDDYPELIAKVSAQTGRTREQFRGCTFTSGFAAANMYGNAFWIEMLTENLFRFHCNDHEMDDDFDDLVFDLEIVELSE